jgi:hypothetical protein
MAQGHTIGHGQFGVAIFFGQNDDCNANTSLQSFLVCMKRCIFFFDLLANFGQLTRTAPQPLIDHHCLFW